MHGWPSDNWFICFYFVCLTSAKDATVTLVYYRLTLINIKHTVDIQFEQECGKPCSLRPPVLSEVPQVLCRLPCFCRKSAKEDVGNEAGFAVKLKAKLLLASRTNFNHHGFRGDWAYHWLVYQRSLEPAYAWIRPIALEIFTKHPIHWMPYLHKSEGVCLQNLRPLCRLSQSVGNSLLIEMALVYARSLCNKTFILRDLFTSKSLDVLFVTEMWLSSGDLLLLTWLSWTVNLLTLHKFLAGWRSSLSF